MIGALRRFLLCATEPTATRTPPRVLARRVTPLLVGPRVNCRHDMAA